MKKLDEQSLELVVGGKLTKQEVQDFATAFSCTLMFLHPLAAIECGLNVTKYFL